MGSRARQEIARWTHGEDWRTWVAHAVIALVITALFGWLLGWLVAVGYYLIRELEQIMYDWAGGKPLRGKWRDRFMDVAAPTAAVLAVVGLGSLVT